MKANTAAKLWKVKIMLGRYPAKISEYRIYRLRKNIIELFDSINVIVFNKITYDEVKEFFVSNPYWIDYTADIVLKEKEKTKKKNKIIYVKNDILRFECHIEEDGIIVKIPKDCNY